MKVAAILFDCDGVLVESETLAHEIETDVLAAIGLHYDAREFRERFMGMSDKAFWAALDEDGIARLGRPVTEEIRGPIKRRMRQAVMEQLTEVAGALACVSAVPHLKAVASSSTTEGLEIKLRKVGLWDHFAPHVYSAEHVTHAKPAPDLFLHAAKALDVMPEHCLVLEDSVNGVLAGRAAGMRVWGFTGGGHMDEAAGRKLAASGAERVVASWVEAQSLFAGIDLV
ncbi:MAG: HAD family phosphatase [Proteobacteria bacterium]|nr:HAD family phosphatase [Pseudomonadota bacterium]